MGIINKMITAATWPAFHQLQKAARAPQAAQEKVWQEVRTVLDKSSYWGAKARGLALKDFPITDYETYREILTKMQADKISSLSGEPIIYWAESGGTSGPAKLFPLTDRYRRQFQKTMGPYLHANATRFAGFADEPIIYLASLLPQRKSPAGIDTGYISIFNYRTIPAPLRKLYVFPLEIFKNAETFREWAPIYAAASDISAVFAITPMKVGQLWDAIWAGRDRILRTLREGKVKVTAARIAHLQNVFSQSQPSMQDLWPSLSVLGCWKTSSCALQLKQLAPVLQGKTPVADAIYSATEGWLTVPLSGETGGVFHPGSHVVEFHEAGQTPQPSSLLKPWELRAGGEYEIFLTTAMGMVRYRLYDVLRCTGYWEKSPILEFKQKANNQISLGTMRVTEDELIQCMAQVGFVPREPFCYAPNTHGNGLVFLTYHEDDLDAQIQEKIHQALQGLSFYYRRDVKEGVVKPIAVQKLAPDHGLWKRTGDSQEKPKILVQEFPQLN